MIFNLVEAAQEFLSGIEPVVKSPESVSLVFHIFCWAIKTYFFFDQPKLTSVIHFVTIIIIIHEILQS